MKHKSKTCVVLILVMAVGVPAVACFWDYDTLMMERNRFPDALELITGKFLRHSQEFYQWRIEDRQKKIADDPNSLSDYDDLAVAYSKTGQHQKAIETILAKDKIKPGLYETEANLGTFYIHDGQLEKGLVHINRAIEINPDAHFGREVYQKLLVEYVLLKRKNGKTVLPLEGPVDRERSGRPLDFADYVLEAQDIQGDRDAELNKALKGVLGMMRFGNYDSPVLLEALSDLLISGKLGGDPDAKRLAARAYLKASYEAKDEATRKAYRKLGHQVLKFQTIEGVTEGHTKLDIIEETFKEELAEADAWFEKVHADEIEWIRDGKDVDEEFARKYYHEPEITGPYSSSRASRIWIAVGVGVGIILLGALWVIRRRRKKRLDDPSGKVEV